MRYFFTLDNLINLDNINETFQDIYDNYMDALNAYHIQLCKILEILKNHLRIK